jgi:hypothetical protein
MNTNSPDFAYYNVVLPYQPNTRPDGQFRLQYIKNNNEPIIDVPEDYVVSIAQMKIPVSLLPIFVAEPEPSAGDVNFTKYFVTLKYNGVSYNQRVIYEPSIVNIPTNSPRYYYVYTYTDFLEMVNKALLFAFTLLQLNNQPVLDNATPPFFAFDSTTQLITLYAEEIYYNLTLPSPIEIFVNEKLRRFFQGFTSKFNPSPSILYEVLQFLVFDKNGLNTQTINSRDYFKMTQDFKALILWNDIETIQFSTSLPIASEYVEVGDGSGTSNSDSILRDFIIGYPDINSANRTSISYTVPNYIFTNLFGTTPIRNIIITGFWTTKNGLRIPLFLTEGETALIKLLFRKKKTL